jgi:hypothetical protein
MFFLLLLQNAFFLSVLLLLLYYAHLVTLPKSPNEVYSCIALDGGTATAQYPNL